ncbi:DUF1361 domain-containing protein [Streptococcus thoraltensis]|uniref:DUF1361 domain-containing protein n=1 Tax=Streptococcus thoraltensis TaxID=55085 RepID=UPI00036A63E9|nr:DUF1361 domain-containing protein [Streptococcus thoraltensis]MDY4761369.1 DUF1361 domain-containing protein [Streptococcus thoraltensis]
MKRQFIVAHGFFAIIALAFWYYSLKGPSLVWNIFLALVAYDFSCLARVTKYQWLKAILLLAWLLFYPNTFYMLTDVVHMSFARDILTDKLSFIYYLIYMSSILLALVAGVLSVRYVINILKMRNWLLQYSFMGIVSFISSLAIHIGRYERLNSWNAITHPSLVIDEILKVFSYSEIHFVLGFTFMQILCLWLLVGKE